MRPVPDHVVRGMGGQAVTLLALAQSQLRGHLIVNIFERSVPTDDPIVGVATRIGSGPAPSVAAVRIAKSVPNVGKSIIDRRQRLLPVPDDPGQDTGRAAGRERVWQ